MRRLPAERGALVIRALQKVVDARKDEREAYYEGLLEGESAPEPATPQEEPHGPGDVSAETESPVADEYRAVGATGLPAGLEFEFSSTEQRYADALVEEAEHYLANGPGKRGRRYEVALTIFLRGASPSRSPAEGSGRNELAGQSAGNGACYHVDPDWGVNEEDARRIACDADVTEFIQDARGNLLNYERRRRIVPARLLRALKLRDHNRCRFPGCAHQRYVEAHHVEHWIDGGETRLDNLVLLCSAPPVAAPPRLPHRRGGRRPGVRQPPRGGDRAGVAASVPADASARVSGETRPAAPGTTAAQAPLRACSRGSRRSVRKPRRRRA